MPKKKVVKSHATKPTSSTRWIVIVGILLVVIAVFWKIEAVNQYIAPMANQQNFSFDFASHFGSASKQDTKLIVNRNLNPEGTRAAAIMIESPGGSGTFYYLLGAMNKDNQEIYSDPVLLGDRIKIVSVTVDNPEEHDNGVITVKYLGRDENIPMTDAPTDVTTVQYAFQDDGKLIKVLE